MDLEKKIFQGVTFPDSGMKVDGRRLDCPTILARLTGAPFWVKEMDIRALFERWGVVVNVDRGTSDLSLPEGVKGVEGSGWRAGYGNEV